MNQTDTEIKAKSDWKTDINLVALLKSEPVKVVVKYKQQCQISIGQYNDVDLILCAQNGQIEIKNFRRIQNFYSNTLLKECDPVQLNPDLYSRGKRTVKIRDLYFFYAMVYFQVKDKVYRLQSSKGYFEIGLSNTEYRKLLAQ